MVGRTSSPRLPGSLGLLFSTGILSLLFIVSPALGATLSTGEPYRGRLIDGVRFPRDMGGYRLIHTDRTYTAPELVGAVLDTLDFVRSEYPDTCDVCIGDFSRRGGGRLSGHSSHQNGRDVDIGMYGKNNRPLRCFEYMSERNLDPEKTWTLITGLLNTGRVELIFLDYRVQRILYRYLLEQGYDECLVDPLFGSVGKIRGDKCVIRHWPKHNNHMHVRFHTPWSTMAALHKGRLDPHKLHVIEMAQQAYLPQRIHYRVRPGEGNPGRLAYSLGTRPDDLRRWNSLETGLEFSPGEDIIYYKRGFEFSPARLAAWLGSSASSIRPASLDDSSLEDILSLFTERNQEQLPSLLAKDAAEASSGGKHVVKKGDTLSDIADRYGMGLDRLCRINGLSRRSTLYPGQVLKLTGDSARAVITNTNVTTASNQHLRVKPGDTLWEIAKRNEVDCDALCRMNGLTEHSVLRPGQVLVLSGSAGGIREVATFPQNAAYRTHIIRPGDTLWELSKKYRTPLSTICRLNRLSKKAVLQPGMLIRLPASAVN